MGGFELEKGEGDRSSLVGSKETSWSKAKSLCVISTGLILISASTFAGLFMPKMVHNALLDMSTVCSTDDSGFPAWESSLDKPSVTKLYLYDVLDAGSTYYMGLETTVEEVGPFGFACGSKKFSVEFSGATVSYQSYSRCEWSKEDSCASCTLERELTNFAPAYGKVMKETVNEGMLVLQASGCSSDQLMAIGGLASGTVKPCDWNPTTWNVGQAGENCACCVPNSAAMTGAAAANATHWRAGTHCGLNPAATTEANEVVAASVCVRTATGNAAMPYVCGTTNPANKTENLYCAFEMDTPSVTAPQGCETLLNDPKGAVKSIAGLSQMDGGVAIGASGAFSELMVTKTASEIAFGYPVVLPGFLIGGQTAQAALTATIEGVNAAVMAQVASGELPAENAEFAIGAGVQAAAPGAVQGALHGYDMGGYTLGKLTEDLVKACNGHCQGDGSDPAATGCAGNVGGDVVNTDTDLHYLKGASYSPLTFAYGNKLQCMAVKDDAEKKCVCSDGTDAWEEGKAPKMCCLAGGTLADGTKMAGRGCVAWTPGWVTPEMNHFNDKKATEYRMSEDDIPDMKKNTGCDVDHPEMIDDVIQYGGKSKSPLWMPPQSNTTYPLPTDIKMFKACADPEDTACPPEAAAVLLKSSSVSGKTGGAVMADGLDTRHWASKTFNDGLESTNVEENGGQLDVFYTHLFRDVEFDHAQDNPVVNKDILLHRYKVNTNILKDNEVNKDYGIGVGHNGISVQTYKYSAPVVVSLPNFLHGSADLYSQGGNLILKQTANYKTNAVLDNAEKVTMTQITVQEQEMDFTTYMDIEASTGKAMRGSSRLGFSMYNFECPVPSPLGAATPAQQNNPNWLACSIFFRRVDEAGGAPNSWLPGLEIIDPSSKSVAGNKLVQMDAAGTAPVIVDGNPVTTAGWARSAANILTPLAKPNVIIPSFWIDMSADIDEATAADFVSKGKMVQMVDIASLIGGAIGAFMCMFGLFSLSKARR